MIKIENKENGMKTMKSGNYFTFTAENATEYEIMKSTKLANNARRDFNDSNMSVEIKGKYNAQEYETLISRSAPVAKTSTANNTVTRVPVVAGTVKVGDVVSGRTVTGLGKWFQPNDCDFYSVNGIDPSADYVQYVYFN